MDDGLPVAMANIFRNNTVIIPLVTTGCKTLFSPIGTNVPKIYADTVALTPKKKVFNFCIDCGPNFAKARPRAANVKGMQTGGNFGSSLEVAGAWTKLLLLLTGKNLDNSCAIKPELDNDVKKPKIVSPNILKVLPSSKWIFKGNKTNGGTKNNGSHSLINATASDKYHAIFRVKLDAKESLTDKDTKIATIAASDDGNVHFNLSNRPFAILSININISIPPSVIFLGEVNTLNISFPCDLLRKIVIIAFVTYF